MWGLDEGSGGPDREGATSSETSSQHESNADLKKERRTCVACMLAKVKCDRQTPACSRCVRLKIAECIEQPNRPGRPYKDPVKRQAANEGRLVNARKKPTRPARRTDERSSMQSSAKQESAFNSGSDLGYRSMHSNAPGHSYGADHYVAEPHLPVPAPATSVWERPNAVPVHLIRDFLLLKERGRLDTERTICVLRGVLMWNMILQRDMTRGLLESLVSHLGFSVHDLLLRPLVPGLPSLAGPDATREDTHCPIRSKPDPVLKLCVRDHGGVLPACLGALDDGISAFAYDTVLPNRPVQLGVNACFLETFFSFEEYRRIIVEQGLVPLFIYASLVARADRADFLSDLAEYLFTDSGSTGSRQMTGVYTFIDRRGASFTGVCRLRSQSLEQGEYTAHAISIFPIPSPCKHLTTPGHTLDPSSSMLRGAFDGAPHHPTQPVTVHLGAHSSSSGPPNSPRPREGGDPDARRERERDTEGSGMEDGALGTLRRPMSSSTSSVASSTGSGDHYARVSANDLQALRGPLAPPPVASLYASRFGPRDGKQGSPSFGYAKTPSGMGGPPPSLCGNAAVRSRADLVEPPPHPPLTLLEAVTLRERDRDMDSAIARGGGEGEMRSNAGPGRGGEGGDRERGQEGGGVWMNPAPDMGPGAVPFTSRGFTSVVSREQASLLMGREVRQGEGEGAKGGGYGGPLLASEMDGRRVDRTERCVPPRRMEPTHPTARGEHLSLF